MKSKSARQPRSVSPKHSELASTAAKASRHSGSPPRASRARIDRRRRPVRSLATGRSRRLAREFHASNASWISSPKPSREKRDASAAIVAAGDNETIVSSSSLSTGSGSGFGEARVCCGKTVALLGTEPFVFRDFASPPILPAIRLADCFREMVSYSAVNLVCSKRPQRRVKNSPMIGSPTR